MMRYDVTLVDLIVLYTNLYRYFIVGGAYHELVKYQNITVESCLKFTSSEHMLCNVGLVVMVLKYDIG